MDVGMPILVQEKHEEEKRKIMPTINDIVYEIRNGTKIKEILGQYDLREWTTGDFRALADRIDAAIKEERKEWCRMLNESEDTIKTLEQKCDAIEKCQDVLLQIVLLTV